MIVQKSKLLLGELLVVKGFIIDDQLRIALLEQKKTGAPLGKQLVARYAGG